MRSFLFSLADATAFVLWSAVQLASIGAFLVTLVLVIMIAEGVLR